MGCSGLLDPIPSLKLWVDGCLPVPMWYCLLAGAGNEADGPRYETDQGPTALTNVDLRAAIT